MKKMAEVTIHMECGGQVVTHFPVKSEKDLLKKLRKSRRDDDFYDFGHVRVDDRAVLWAGFKIHDIH